MELYDESLSEHLELDDVVKWVKGIVWCEIETTVYDDLNANSMTLMATIEGVNIYQDNCLGVWVFEPQKF